MKNKLAVVLLVIFTMSLASCNNEKNDEIKVKDSSSTEKNIISPNINVNVEKTVNIEKSISDFDEKLIDQVVKPLLEIK